MPQDLLLTNTYEFNSFIGENRAIKLLFNNKVDIISAWEDINIYWINGEIKLPAILRLVNPIKKFSYNPAHSFSRRAIIKRDKSSCQYCGKHLSTKDITIDHVVPKSQGGNNSFINCVVSCLKCNSLKSNKNLEESGLRLINKPQVPNYLIYQQPDDKDWHKDWLYYLDMNQ